jgi:membrane protease YdiL (CAAX protease family)
MNTTKKKRKFSLTDNLVWILLTGLVIILAGELLGGVITRKGIAAVLEALIPGASSSVVWRASRLYMSFIGTWIVALLIMIVNPRNRPMLNALTPKTKGNTLKLFAVGIAIGLGMNLLCAVIALANGDIVLSFNTFQLGAFLYLSVAVLIQSAAEELVCRVFIYQRLVRRYGKPVLAAVANAAFFALIHLANPGITFLAVLNIFIYGLLFSAIVVYMDSPWAAMGAHAAWNFCQNIILGLPNSGMVTPYSVFKLETAAATDSFAYSVAFGLEGTITACVTLSVVAALIVWWGTKHKVAPTPVWEAEA